MSTKRILGMFAAVLVGVGTQACMTEYGGEDVGTLEEEVALPPPTNLQVTVVSTTQMNLTWDVSVGATKYLVLRGLTPGSETSFTTVTPNSFNYNHLLPNTQYCWQVKNFNASGEVSGASNEVCASTATGATTPAPTNVVATAISSSRISVSWDAVPGATSYQIWQGLPPAAPTYKSAVVAPTVSFTSAGLAAGTTYSYEIRAISSVGTSVASTPLATATTFSAGLEAYYKFDEKMGTTANDASGFVRTGTLAGGAVFAMADKPQVENDLSVLSLPTTVTAKLTVPNTSAFNLAAGAPFTVALWVKTPTAGSDFHIIGMRNSGCGTRGWEIGQDTTNNLYFAGASTVRSFGSALPVGAWTHVAVTSNGTNLTTYVNGTSTSTGAFSVNNSLKLPLTVGHLGDCTGGAVLADELYVYSRELSASEIAAIGKLPDPPTNLAVVVTSSTRQDLSWTAVAGASKYLVYKGTTSGDEVFFTSSPATTPTFAYGHLLPSTQYSWQVAVMKNGLYSNRSTEVIATTLGGPETPANVTATVLSSSRIRLDWTASTGAVSYRIYQSTAGGAYAYVSTTTALTFTAANLTTMTNYSYQIQAVDSGNSLSAFSTPVSATTL